MNDYRRLLVHVGDSERASRVLACAATLAAQHGAALHAVHAVEPPHLGAHLSAETAMLATRIRQDDERKRHRLARDRVQAAAHAHGMQIDFESPGGDPVEAVVSRSWAADMLIVSQPADDDPGSPTQRFVSHLLVAGGCPVLLAPEAESVLSCGRRVLVAWSARRESTRAMRDALPLLQRAAAVEVLSLRSANAVADARAEKPLDAVAAYLKAHGVAAVCTVKSKRDISFGERMLTPSVVDASVAELLLSHAADMDADLIVMGGYGHSRAYEMVLGGVTRTMLASMTVPVLMSH